MPNEIPKRIRITKKLKIFRFLCDFSSTPQFSQKTSSGSGALLMVIN